MAIETAPKAAPAHKANGSADARASKAKGSPDAQGADAGALGFMAILSSVGEAPSEEAALTDTTTDTTTGPLAVGMTDPAAVIAQGQPAVDAQPANAALTAQMPGSVAKPAAGIRADAGLNADAALPGATESRTKGLQRTMGQTRPDKTAAGPESNLAIPTHAQAQPQHDFKLFLAMEAQRNLQSAPEPELVLAALGGNGEKSTAERSLFARQSSDATYSGAALDAGAVEFSSSAPLEVTPVLETQAAEQVKYWISQDVQNAELKLDGLGENPVEVTISMHGNEAHVSFRTDELQTHSLLEGAGAQLKDMLLREGVVLAGVSVGTSGTNDGKGGERRSRQGVKIVQVTAEQTPPMEAPRRLAGSAGRSVDLFV